MERFWKVEYSNGVALRKETFVRWVMANKGSKIKLSKWLLITISMFCGVKPNLIQECDMLVENNIQGVHLFFWNPLNKNSLWENYEPPKSHDS